MPARLPSNPRRYRDPRRRRLVLPGLQVRLTLTFVGVVLLGLLLQFSLLSMRLSQMLAELHDGGDWPLLPLPDLLLRSFVLTALLSLPLAAWTGLRATFRVVGPLARLQRHLERIVQGEDPGTFHVRRGDELQELCEHVNEALLQGRAESGEREAA